jgi:hypothetical protein
MPQAVEVKDFRRRRPRGRVSLARLTRAPQPSGEGAALVMLGLAVRLIRIARRHALQNRELARCDLTFEFLQA